jgi:hypothetical protein
MSLQGTTRTKPDVRLSRIRLGKLYLRELSACGVRSWVRQKETGSMC